MDIEGGSSWSPGSAGEQPYEGPLYSDPAAAHNLMRVGEVSPTVREAMRAQHGRYLSGLGSEGADDAHYQGQLTYAMEEQDDSFGSGIFDPPGRGATANAGMGVLSSNYALPGYIAREVPFTVSRDVTDINSGAEVVNIPAGGLVVVEDRGKLTRPAVLGPTWVPPSIEPAGVTGREQPYAFLNRPGQPSSALHPGAPVRPPPSYRPDRAFGDVSMVPADAVACPVPMNSADSSVRSRSLVYPQDPALAIPAERQGACTAGEMRGLGEDEIESFCHPAAYDAQMRKAQARFALAVDEACARRMTSLYPDYFKRAYFRCQDVMLLPWLHKYCREHMGVRGGVPHITEHRFFAWLELRFPTTARRAAANKATLEALGARCRVGARPVPSGVTPRGFWSMPPPVPPAPLRGFGQDTSSGQGSSAAKWFVGGALVGAVAGLFYVVVADK